ncbi:hypothetical protein CMI47_00915 [Candidatus Pacearchaeota archaeon]|nr:hypothetical protein [Candidatus Pacearchaeota archaeon]
MQRMEELALFRTPLRWRDAWAILVRGRWHMGTEWSEQKLWNLRYWNWVVALADDALSCRTCGSKISSDNPLARYCSTGCRKVAYRRKRSGALTPLEELKEEGLSRLADLRRDIESSHRWVRRKTKSANGPRILVAPDLTGVDHLPGPPSPCGAGCEQTSPCEHTDGSVCLLAGTGRWGNDPEEAEVTQKSSSGSGG